MRNGSINGMWLRKMKSVAVKLWAQERAKRATLFNGEEAEGLRCGPRKESDLWTASAKRELYFLVY